MLAIPSSRHGGAFANPGQFDTLETARRSNRRRLTVFAVVFLATLLPGLAWNVLRTPEYRANARLQIASGAAAPGVEKSGPGETGQEPPKQRADILTQVQVLNSRALLEEVVRRLDKQGQSAANRDMVAELQSSIGVSPVPGTDIVELQALGPSPQRLATILNTLIEVYRDQLFASHGNASEDAARSLREEVDRLGANIEEKRTQLAAFRVKSGVVSSERAENEALARIKGLSESLNKANEDAAKAEARLRALRESANAGRNSGISKDNPTLAAIEQRISTTREDLRDMERTYTPEFMAMDPVARALRARLAELERQLETTRSHGQQAALAAAEEEAAGTRATVDRLRGQIESQRREAQQFSGSFHQAQAMEDDLARLETARRNAMERLARLEASESGRQPALQILEAAAVPRKPAQPDYGRDALFNLLASFLLGLGAMWFVELFNRSPAPVGHTVIMPPAWTPPLMGDLSSGRREPVLGNAAPPIPQLPPAPALPRELTQDEAVALLAAADGEGRALCAVLLLGATPREVAALAARDLDPANRTLTIPGPSARLLALPDWLVQSLAANRGDDPDSPLFRNAAGQALGESDIAARLACAALDAGLNAAATVSPEALRHTCIAWLLRQNVRFSDLSGLVGQLGAEELAAYAERYPEPQRVGRSEIDPVMPALQAGA